MSDTLSDAISGEVAARSDPEVIETKLGQRIGDLRAKLKQDMSDLRLSLVGEIRTLDAKIEAAKADTSKWMVGIVGFQTVSIVGAAVVLARILGH